MINKVILIGNLGADPEMRHAQNGKAVTTFNVATSERWKGQDGQMKDSTEWHKIVAWDRLAETCSEYLHKGSKVYIEGKLQTRKWQDKEGHDRWTTEIIAKEVQFLTPKDGEGGGDYSGKMNDQGGGQGGYTPQGGGGGNQYSYGDQVPF